MIFTHIILYRQNTYWYIQIHTNTCTHSLHPADLPCVGTLIPSATPSWCSRSKCLGCKLSKIPSASCVYMYLHVCVCMCMSALWFFLSHWHRIDTYRYIQIHTDTYIYALDTYTIHTYTYKYIQLPLWSQIEETLHSTAFFWNKKIVSPLAHYVGCFPTGPPVSLSVSPSSTPAAAGGAGGSRASRWRDVTRNLKWPTTGRPR